MIGASHRCLPDATGPESLSPRELEVLRLMCDGMFSKEIGRALGVSYRSIQIYRVNLRRKTGCRTPCQMGVWAERNGILFGVFRENPLTVTSGRRHD